MGNAFYLIGAIHIIRFLAVMDCISALSWKNHLKSQEGNLVSKSIPLCLSVNALEKGGQLALATGTEIAFILVSHKA